MEREDFAVILGAVSLFVAGTSLGWNIFRDLVLKPRMKVSIDCGFLASEVMPATQKIVISGTNFGPGKLKVSIVRWKRVSVWARLKRTARWGFLIHDYKSPISGQLPKMLEVGERVDLIFPFEKSALLSERPTRVGLRDYFGRDHWAPRSELKKAQAQYDEHFGREA